MKTWIPEEAMTDALQKHPDCTYADWTLGLNMNLQVTIVVRLWRNKECYLNGDPPRIEAEGYLKS